MIAARLVHGVRRPLSWLITGGNMWNGRLRPAGTYHTVSWRPHPSDPHLQLPVLLLRNKGEVTSREYLPATNYLFGISASPTTLKKLPSMLGLIWDCLVELEISPDSLADVAAVKNLMIAICRFLLYGARSFTAGQHNISSLGWSPRSERVVDGLGLAFDAFVRDLPSSVSSDDPFLSRCPGLFGGSFSVAYKKARRDSSGFSRVAHRGEASIGHNGPPEPEPAAPKPILDKLKPKNERKKPYILSPTKRFPKDHLIPFLTKGFRVGSKAHPRDETGEFAARLLLGGIRGSEVINLWVSDLTLLGGRRRGYLRSPTLFKEQSGRTRREELEKKYGLLPRTEIRGKNRAGFKSPALDGGHSATIYWMVGSEEFLGQSFARYILNVRAPAMAERRALGYPDHPYLLVFPKSIPHLGIVVGDPYTMGAFRSSWKRAVRRYARIAKLRDMDVAKYLGTTIHAVRHLSGKTHQEDGDGIQRIQIKLHHKSILSSIVYTIPDDEEIHKAAEEVKERIKSGKFKADFRQFATMEESVRTYAESVLGGRFRRW
ncbi:hypothetical protein SAMN04487976_12018 [Xaviernesmea oryzae]|nr:hypothetical protein SAMN04487976_12018 [Xaviernesmea oryzae]